MGNTIIFGFYVLFYFYAHCISTSCGARHKRNILFAVEMIMSLRTLGQEGYHTAVPLFLLDVKFLRPRHPPSLFPHPPNPHLIGTLFDVGSPGKCQNVCLAETVVEIETL